MRSLTDISNKIIEINPLLLEHDYLIRSPEAFGLNRPFTNTLTGLTFVISKDRVFTQEWHEGAHSFITQRSTLGLVLSVLSSILHNLFFEMDLENEKLSKDDYQKKLLFFKRVKELRNSIVENCALSHEIFAISTEMRGILEEFEWLSHLIEEMKQTIVEHFISMDMEINLLGYPVHKKALRLIKNVAEAYGHFFYAIKAAEHILNIAVSLITNVAPSALLYGKEGQLKSVLSAISDAYDYIIEKRPLWAPDGKFLIRSTSFFQIIMEYLSSQSVYKNIFHNFKLLPAWLTELHSLVPIGEKYKGFYDVEMDCNLRYALIEGEPRQAQLRKFVKFEQIDKNDYKKAIKRTDLKEYKKYLEDSFGIELPEKNEVIYQDPLSIPPPLVLIKEPDSINLYIRSDINTNIGLTHMTYRTGEVGLIEDILNKAPMPIICFYDYCHIKPDNCADGPENCAFCECTRRRLASFEQANSKELSIGLMCCKDNFAYFVELRSPSYKPMTSFKMPFKMTVFDPVLAGRKIRN